MTIDSNKTAFRIMVIDDCPHAGKTAELFLKKQGHTALCCQSAIHALGTVTSFKPEIIFIDADMPTVTGFQACDLLREFGGTENIPLFILSGTGNAENRAEGRMSGATGFVLKPLDDEKLTAALAAISSTGG